MRGPTERLHRVPALFAGASHYLQANEDGQLWVVSKVPICDARVQRNIVWHGLRSMRERTRILPFKPGTFERWT